MSTLLDNIIWNCLSGPHARFAAGTGAVRRYAPGFHDEMLVALKRQGADLEIAQELGEFSTMLALVSAGLGIGVIPAEAATALPPRVVARPLELAGHRADIGLAYTHLDSAVKRALLSVMEESVRGA